jgi:hypothetical protein
MESEYMLRDHSRSALAAFSLLSIFIGSSAATPATAQDYMEAQRCVWRCFEHTGGRQPAYNQCSRQCDEPPGAGQSKRRMTGTADYSTETEPGKWAYGTHPVMGKGAFVNVGDGTFGVTCPPPLGRWVASVRISKSLKPATVDSRSAFATVFTGPYQLDAVHDWKLSENGYFESVNDICTTKIPELMKSASYVILNAEGHGIEDSGDGYILTVKGANGLIAIKTEAEIDQIPGNTVIPLSGSGKAIKRLMAECPAFRQQMAEGCEAPD